MDSLANLYQAREHQSLSSIKGQGPYSHTDAEKTAPGHLSLGAAIDLGHSGGRGRLKR